MTIKEFMNAFELKNEKTVLNWLEKDLIAGAHKDEETGEWGIPELARPPYTRARAKTADSIYVSIVDACNKRKSVCAKLYKISEIEFEEYISNLVAAKLISIKEVNGIKYCFATPTSQSYLDDKNALKKFVKFAIKTVIEATVKTSIEATVTRLAA